MAERRRIGPARQQVAGAVQARIERGGERIWRFRDFQDLPFEAVAQALSRLVGRGGLQRLSKGVYYRSRPTAFGESLPNPATMQTLVRGAFPAGLSAARLLGFTRQVSRRGEVATSGGSLPRKLLGHDTVVYPRRPAAWRSLSLEDGALLDLLRRGGRGSDLDPRDAIRRLQKLLSEPGRFVRLAKVASTEPPRVRAILGAVGEEIGVPLPPIAKLRASLNPLSRFDFGLFSELPNARKWQAKAGRSHAVV